MGAVLDIMEDDVDSFMNAVLNQLSVCVASQVTQYCTGKAQASILNNMSVVCEIEDISEDDLKVFMKDVEFYEFTSSWLCTLRGLSAADGSRAYINNDSLHDPDQLQRTIEHEYMHNLSRWKKNDPFRISPAKNGKLRSKTDAHAMLEAGKFYLERVYGIVYHLEEITPF